MAIALDGHATGGNSASASTTVTLTTTKASDVIVVQAVGVNASGPITVASVTATGLTFTKRTALTFSTNDTLEIWWAPAAAALSATVITVNWTSSVTAANVAALCAFGVSGANVSAPWDTDGSLPATATGSNSVPTVTGVSTGHPDDILVSFSAELTALTETAGTGYTLIDSATQGAVTAADQYKVVSSTQSSVSPAFGTTTTASWSMIADAIQALPPFAQYDWPTPQPVQWYRDWSQTPDLTTIYLFVPRSPVYGPRIVLEWDRHWAPNPNIVLTRPSGKPFNQNDWPLPGRYPSSTDYRSYENWYKLQLIGKDKLPKNQYDWPNPKRYPASTEYRAYEESYLMTLIGKDKLPFRQQDWPLPTPPRYWDLFYSEDLLQSTLFVIGRAPFNQQDWPNPYPVSWYRDWNQNLVLSHPSGMPFNQDDWPNPGRWPLTTEYRDWSQTLVLIRPSGKPFNQQDWSLPERVLSSTGYRDWQQSIVLTYPSGKPFNQQDWPNPYPVSWYRDWLQNLVLTYPSGKPFNQQDWPNPSRWSRATEYRDWGQTLVLLRPSGKPFNQRDWPLPGRREFYRDWGQTLVLLRPSGKPFNQQDWPLSPDHRPVWYRDEGQNLVIVIPAPVPPPFTGPRKPLFTGSGTFSPNYWPGKT